MSTFGDTGTSGSDAGFGNGEVQFKRFALSEAAAVSSMSVYGKSAGSVAGRMAIYTDASNSPDTLVWVSAQGNFGTSNAWLTCNKYGVWSDLSAASYWLALWTGGTGSFVYGGTTGPGWYDSGITYHATNNPPSPFDTGGAYNLDIRMYATYTPTASGLLIPVAMHYRAQQ